MGKYPLLLPHLAVLGHGQCKFKDLLGGVDVGMKSPVSWLLTLAHLHGNLATHCHLGPA